MIGQRIVTRGMGRQQQLVCTRGYGLLTRRIREVIRLCLCLARRVEVKAPWKPTASS